MTQTSPPTTSFWTAGRIVAAFLGLIVLALAAANFDSVEVNFLLFKVTLPLFFLIVGTLVIGYVAGWLLKRSRAA
jgi:uncharacterized integral membrane protein